MQTTIAPPLAETDDDTLTALVADVAADPRPPARLLARLQALDEAGDAASAAIGTSLFESIHYRLPAFPDDELPLLASRLYARGGRGDAALLLAGLAVQLRPAFAPARDHLDATRDQFAVGAVAPDPAISARMPAILEVYEQGDRLLLALEALDSKAGRAPSAMLFEAIWPRVRPMAQFWVYARMAQVYGDLGRADAAFLLATLAVQIWPVDGASDGPYRMLLRYFRANGRLRDAAELCVRRAALCPVPVLLGEPEVADLLAAAGPLLLSPPPAGRRDRLLMQREVRVARPWPTYGAGVPQCLVQLLGNLTRDEIRIAEVENAEVLINRGAVAVFGADAAPHSDLSMRCFPPLLRRQIAEQALPVEEIETEAAVVISDGAPEPNLCHFLLDHATRLELYRRAGVEIGGVTVIGPELRHEYQTATAERMGVRGYVPVSGRTRLRAERLWVSSTCHTTRHPGHWGAPWAVNAVRGCFDLVPRDRARRLLISRRDTTYRRLANEAQLINLLEPLGFEVIVPGSLSFMDQIAAFRDATHIIGPHGAGLANILWCAPGTHVLEVFHPHYGTWAYGMLNDVLDLNYATLVARDGCSDAPEFNDTSLPRELTMPHSGRDMWVDPDELERWLIESGVL